MMQKGCYKLEKTDPQFQQKVLISPFPSTAIIRFPNLRTLTIVPTRILFKVKGSTISNFMPFLNLEVLSWGFSNGGMLNEAPSSCLCVGIHWQALKERFSALMIRSICMRYFLQPIGGYLLKKMRAEMK